MWINTFKNSQPQPGDFLPGPFYSSTFARDSWKEELEQEIRPSSAVVITHNSLSSLHSLSTCIAGRKVMPTHEGKVNRSHHKTTIEMAKMKTVRLKRVKNTPPTVSNFHHPTGHWANIFSWTSQLQQIQEERKMKMILKTQAIVTDKNYYKNGKE